MKYILLLSIIMLAGISCEAQAKKKPLYITLSGAIMEKRCDTGYTEHENHHFYFELKTTSGNKWVLVIDEPLYDSIKLGSHYSDMVRNKIYKTVAVDYFGWWSDTKYYQSGPKTINYYANPKFEEFIRSYCCCVN
jgi:hypothetical protein